MQESAGINPTNEIGDKPRSVQEQAIYDLSEAGFSLDKDTEIWLKNLGPDQISESGIYVYGIRAETFENLPLARFDSQSSSLVAKKETPPITDISDNRLESGVFAKIITPNSTHVTVFPKVPAERVDKSVPAKVAFGISTTIGRLRAVKTVLQSAGDEEFSPNDLFEKAGGAEDLVNLESIIFPD